MENLIQRVRMAQDAIGDCEVAREAVHESVVVESNVPEEEFFLAWMAAKILRKEPQCF